MNKKQLIDSMAEKSGLKQTECGKALDAFLDTVTDALKDGDGVALIGFGSFAVKDRPAREGVNPATGKKIQIAAKKVVKFKSGSALDGAIQ